MTIAVVIAGGGTHSCLFAAIFVKGDPSICGNIGEDSVPVVVIEDARGAVAGDIDVRPSIFIVVERRNAEAVVTVGLLDVAGFADVCELSPPRLW
jgi:hypothetical protein